MSNILSKYLHFKFLWPLYSISVRMFRMQWTRTGLSRLTTASFVRSFHVFHVIEEKILDAHWQFICGGFCWEKEKWQVVVISFQKQKQPIGFWELWAKKKQKRRNPNFTSRSQVDSELNYFLSRVHSSVIAMSPPAWSAALRWRRHQGSIQTN